ncbi:MAG: nucleoid-associated protein [Clostridiaceae bacterium]
MDYIKEIEIKSAAVGVLDSSSDTPIFSESELTMKEDSYEYLIKHIEKALSSEELKYGMFKGNFVKDKTDEFFSQNIDLVSLTKSLGKRLFTLIKEEVGINSCSMAVLSLSSDMGKTLCILKLDYIKNYISNIDVKDEKLFIDINWKFNSLPGINGKVTKAAFILENKKDFDLYILDTKGNENENYFREKFIEAEIVENDRDKTKKLIKASKNFVKEALSDDLEENIRVQNQLYKKLKNEETIDIEKTADEMFKDADKAMEFKNYLFEQGVEKNVQIDNSYSEKKLKRIRIKIDKDMDLYVNEQSYDDKDRFEVVRNGDGLVSVLIKNVRNLEEK